MKRILPWTPLIVALILGLVLGLLIGWVWWPVSWTNAALVDLSPSARAAYVSAVAQAYVLDGTQVNTVRMQDRLAPLGDELDATIIAALEYLRSQPMPDEVQVANVGKLAIDLGIPVDAAMVAAAPVDGAAGEVAAADTAPAADSAPASAASGGSRWRGVLTWLLALIISAGLIGAGFFLLLRLRPRELTDAMKEPAPPTLPGELRPPAPVMAGGGNGSSAPRTTAWSNGDSGRQSSKGDDDLSFEADDDEEPAVRFSGASGDEGAPDADDDFAPSTPRYASARPDAATYSGYTGSSYDSEPALPAPAAPALLPGKGAPAAALPAAAVPAARSSAPAPVPTPAAPTRPLTPAPAAPALPADAPPVDIDALTVRSWAAVEPKAPAKPAPTKPAVQRAPEAANAAQAAPPAPVVTTGVAVAESRTPAPAAAPPARPAAPPLASFTLQYLAGIPDYIEACNISEPGTGAFIGECGLAVSGQNPVLHANRDQVIALEVWMVDCADPQENVNQTRVLLSPYAVARNLKQAFSVDGPTLEARKGLRFDVEGRNLLLQGELLDVEYDANGIFRSARVKLDILRHK